MADEVGTGEETPKKASKLPMILGLVLALVGGGGGFYAVQSGLLFGADKSADMSDGDMADDTKDTSENASEKAKPSITDVSFVPIDPLVIALGEPHGHLLFRAQLEVQSAYSDDVTKMMPRVVDVLNNYLRALDVEDLAETSSLARLRAQMLRRVQVVTGTGRVDDLLIMEFVLN
ncbi:MAG: flagellar basal body-associated protein FliL [Roseovarius sp.]